MEKPERDRSKFVGLNLNLKHLIRIAILQFSNAINKPITIPKFELVQLHVCGLWYNGSQVSMSRVIDDRCIMSIQGKQVIFDPFNTITF